MREDIYDIHPPSARWTHVALRVTDIEKSIDWYLEHTPLELIDKRRDAMGFGAWLGHKDNRDSPFLLVMAQFLPETDPFKDAPIATLAPFAHLGIELTSREELEELAAKAEEAGSLAMPPTEMPPPIGYICMLSDPDGNMIEYSYDQGVYAKAREVMT